MEHVQFFVTSNGSMIPSTLSTPHKLSKISKVLLRKNYNRLIMKTSPFNKKKCTLKTNICPFTPVFHSLTSLRRPNTSAFYTVRSPLASPRQQTYNYHLFQPNIPVESYTAKFSPHKVKFVKTLKAIVSTPIKWPSNIRTTNNNNLKLSLRRSTTKCPKKMKSEDSREILESQIYWLRLRKKDDNQFL